MRCTVLAIGTRGDVQPLLTLAAGLRAAGVNVVCATHADFADAARALGLTTKIVLGDSAPFFGGAVGVAMRDRAGNPEALRRFLDNYLPLAYEKLLGALTEAGRDTDAVIAWPFGRGLTSLAEAFRIPVIVACPYPPPHLPSTLFPSPFAPAADYPDERSIRRSWRRSFPVLQMNHAAVNRWRAKALGLGPIVWRDDLRRLRRLPHLLGYSSAVVPRPADWAPWINVTGYWFDRSTSSYAPPPELSAFLDRGPAPVVIGFSSQVDRDPARLTRTVVEGVTEAGVRAVIVTGFGGLTPGSLPEQVLAIPTVPYPWLFSRSSAVVHHGGSGSLAAALQAGLPNMAVPFGFDQLFWGGRAHALGVGPAPLPASTLTSSSLAQALRILTTNMAMQQRARKIGEQIRSEDGLGRAVSAVIATLEQHRSHPAAS